jgi:hypothetical protein
MRTILSAFSLAVCLNMFTPAFLSATDATGVKPGHKPLTRPGEKVNLASGYYLTYGFHNSPRLGMAIMKVEISGKNGKRDTSFTVVGDADMPSMRGSHNGGERPFSVSTKGLYLLPVRLVMPGKWEVSFTVSKNGKTAYRGAYLFDL